MKNPIAAAAATSPSPRAAAPLPGVGAKLIESTSVPTSTADSTPPKLSTGSVVSLTWPGTNAQASSSAISANGSVTTKTEPHQKVSSRAPAARMPSAEDAPPIADHKAMARVRPFPAHSAVINARVVG